MGFTIKIQTLCFVLFRKKERKKTSHRLYKVYKSLYKQRTNLVELKNNKTATTKRTQHFLLCPEHCNGGEVQ